VLRKRLAKQRNRPIDAGFRSGEIADCTHAAIRVLVNTD
jgi:hypothetical protein